MDKQTTVNILDGEFTIQNTLTIGQETTIAVNRATITNGMFGKMIESSHVPEWVAAWRISRMCELDGRMFKAPEDWKGCHALTPDELDELWSAWTEKSGMFPKKEVESTGAEAGD